jgi:hypothetical protein
VAGNSVGNVAPIGGQATRNRKPVQRAGKIAERVEFLNSPNRSTGQANAETPSEEPAAVGGAAPDVSAA